MKTPLIEAGTPEVPAHMLYPVWDIGEEGPQAVADYLTWVLDDDERAASAANCLGYLKIGMHFLTAGQRFNDNGEVVDKLELNFWSEDYPPEGTQASGGHGHSRAPRLWSFIDPDARQHVSGIMLLPAEARPAPGVKAEEHQLAVLNKVDDGRGLGTQYHPLVLGPRFVTEYAVDLPPLSRQRFESTFIHDVRYSARDNAIGVTVQRQGPAEHPDLNTLEGLTTYKGLTIEEAERVLAQADALQRTLSDRARFVGSTILVRSFEFDPTKMEEGAIRPPEGRFEELAVGALRSLKRLGARPRVASHFISRSEWADEESQPQVGERVAFADLPTEVQSDLEAARELTATKKILDGKNIKVGCVIASDDERYAGVNIKRDYGIHITHAEELAVGEALVAGVRIGRVALYGEVDGQGSPAVPCGNCREILAHALRVNGQEDVTIYAMGNPSQEVIKVQLSELLPLANNLLKRAFGSARPFQPAADIGMSGRVGPGGNLSCGQRAQQPQQISDGFGVTGHSVGRQVLQLPAGGGDDLRVEQFSEQGGIQ